MQVSVPPSADASSPGSTSDLVLSGDSHVCALGAPCILGLSSARVEPVAREGSTILSVEGPFPRDLAYWQDVVRFSGGRTAAICWGGNQHNQWFLFAPRPLFDFVVASRPDLPADAEAQLVSESMVRELFWPSVAILSAMIEELARSQARIILLGTPPPKRDEEVIRGYLQKEPLLMKLAAEKGYSMNDVAVTPAITRLKLWRVIQDMMAEIATGSGGSFVEVPPETQDDLGFLVPEFWAPDATHANNEYGRLMLNRLLDHVAA